jgi:hypothetical protein
MLEILVPEWPCEIAMGSRRMAGKWQAVGSSADDGELYNPETQHHGFYTVYIIKQSNKIKQRPFQIKQGPKNVNQIKQVPCLILFVCLPTLV